MMTGVGMILGTAAYMSPEQARGKPVDKRADIWAFGCVLYEMLTGRRAFEDEDVSLTLSQVLQREPDFDALPPSVPPRVRQALRVCLRKDPKQRAATSVTCAWRSRARSRQPLRSRHAGHMHGHGRARLAWRGRSLPSPLLAAAVLAIPAVRYLRETPPPSPPETRADISTPATSNPISFALSPDGRQLVFAAIEDGVSRLWLRPLGATSAQPLPGTEGAALPFWSPDSKSVAFFADGKLKRIDLGGGRPLPIADAASGRGGTWNAEGVILFAPTDNSPLFRVPASGGAPVAVTTLDRRTSHRMPFFLPDGRQFLFSRWRRSGQRRAIYLGSMDSAETHRADADRHGARRLRAVGMAPVGTRRHARGAASGLGAEGTHRRSGHPGRSRDRRRLTPRAARPVGVGERVWWPTGRADQRSQRQLTWFDRSGKALGVLGAADDSGLIGVQGCRPTAAVWRCSRTVQGNTDIWILDGTRTSRFTFDPSSRRIPRLVARRQPDRVRLEPERSPRPVPEGGEWRRERGTPVGVGAGQDRQLLVAGWPLPSVSQPWIRRPHRTCGCCRSDGDRKPFVFLSTPFDERTGEFSPDGKWVAYQSTESGRYEILRAPVPGTRWSSGRSRRQGESRRDGGVTARSCTTLRRTGRSWRRRSR